MSALTGSQQQSIACVAVRARAMRCARARVAAVHQLEQVVLALVVRACVPDLCTT
jgi:hypothetical protein